MTSPDTAALAAIAPSAAIENRRDGVWITAADLDVEAMAREMTRLGFRLSTMTGLAHADGETALIYHFAAAGRTVHFKTFTRGATLPSIAPIVRAASWIEREIHDFFNVLFSGHPNLAPLLRPAELRAGFFRDAAEVPLQLTRSRTEPS
ncbi:MAG TPA: NADH-quinone oxidoreductase subunit C [Pseudomonadota bacterium]|nr:NADH-quinone oxidoreductase subunit C [Pseudomonadota bacterium]